MGCPLEATFLPTLLCSEEGPGSTVQIQAVTVANDGWKVGSVCVRGEWVWGTEGVGVAGHREGFSTLQCGDDLGPANLSQSYFWSCMLSCSAL